MKRFNFTFLKEILFESDPRPIELSMVIFNLFFGVILCIKQNLFDNVAVYAKLENTYEWMWGVLLLVVALVRIYGMGTDMKPVRRYASIFSMLIWAFWFYSLVTSPTIGLMTAVACILFFMSFWVLFRFVYSS
jgi:hypothetical protein